MNERNEIRFSSQVFLCVTKGSIKFNESYKLDGPGRKVEDKNSSKRRWPN